MISFQLCDDLGLRHKMEKQTKHELGFWYKQIGFDTITSHKKHKHRSEKSYRPYKRWKTIEHIIKNIELKKISTKKGKKLYKKPLDNAKCFKFKKKEHNAI